MKDRLPVEWAVKGIVQLPSLNIFYGAPGAFKTFLLMDMAMSIAIGQPWLPSTSDSVHPRETMRLPVLWVNQDMSTRQTSDRLKQLCLGHGASPKTDFVYYSMPSPQLDMSNPVHVEQLKKRILGCGSRVVFIDNLITINGGVEENTADMNIVMTNLRQLSEQTQAAINVLHHRRKQTGTLAEAVNSLEATAVSKVLSTSLSSSSERALTRRLSLQGALRPEV